MENNEFSLNIRLANDAMQESESIAVALEEAAAKVRDGRTDGVIVDYNGNRVGNWSIS